MSSNPLSLSLKLQMGTAHFAAYGGEEFPPPAAWLRPLWRGEGPRKFGKAVACTERSRSEPHWCLPRSSTLGGYYWGQFQVFLWRTRFGGLDSSAKCTTRSFTKKLTLVLVDEGRVVQLTCADSGAITRCPQAPHSLRREHRGFQRSQ